MTSMTAAAADFLDALGSEQRAAAQRPSVDDPVRSDWHYVPRSRPGVALGDLDRPQRKAVHRLVASGLRAHAYAQATTIMAFEDVLDRVESGSRGRHSSDYSTIVFGEPGRAQPWAWRFEGHHLSLNVTLAGGRMVAGTPCFFGANPASVRHDGDVVLRPLPAEEAVARAALAALTPDERADAVVADSAPSDIRTRAAARVPGRLEPGGVAFGDVNPTAARLLRRLAATYVDRLPEAFSAAHYGQLIAEDFTAVHFAWEGAAEPGQPHYYRLQAPNLLVEYDNTQNGANHIHTVCRDPAGDFGGDLLGRHYAEHHAR